MTLSFKRMRFRMLTPHYRARIYITQDLHERISPIPTCMTITEVKPMSDGDKLLIKEPLIILNFHYYSYYYFNIINIIYIELF